MYFNILKYSVENLINNKDYDNIWNSWRKVNH